jgi:hypothetical protein
LEKLRIECRLIYMERGGESERDEAVGERKKMVREEFREPPAATGSKRRQGAEETRTRMKTTRMT